VYLSGRKEATMYHCYYRDCPRWAEASCSICAGHACGEHLIPAYVSASRFPGRWHICSECLQALLTAPRGEEGIMIELGGTLGLRLSARLPAWCFGIVPDTLDTERWMA
jgi:hypothetical protein